jgi:hypothetical protein
MSDSIYTVRLKRWEKDDRRVVNVVTADEIKAEEKAERENPDFFCTSVHAPLSGLSEKEKAQVRFDDLVSKARVNLLQALRYVEPAGIAGRDFEKFKQARVNLLYL